MTKTGIISAWRAAEGHGFITPSDGSFDIVFTAAPWRAAASPARPTGEVHLGHGKEQ